MGLEGLGAYGFPGCSLPSRVVPMRMNSQMSKLASHAGPSVPSCVPHPSAPSPLVLAQVRARFVERFSMGAPVMGGEVRGPAITGEAWWEGCCCHC